MPKKDSEFIDNHAICAVGYDDKKNLVKFKNSLGEGWGDNGYGYLPYAYIRNFMMDAWSSMDIDDPEPLCGDRRWEIAGRNKK